MRPKPVRKLSETRPNECPKQGVRLLLRNTDPERPNLEDAFRTARCGLEGLALPSQVWMEIVAAILKRPRTPGEPVVQIGMAAAKALLDLLQPIKEATPGAGQIPGQGGLCTAFGPFLTKNPD